MARVLLNIHAGLHLREFVNRLIEGLDEASNPNFCNLLHNLVVEAGKERVVDWLVVFIDTPPPGPNSIGDLFWMYAKSQLTRLEVRRVQGKCGSHLRSRKPTVEELIYERSSS